MKFKIVKKMKAFLSLGLVATMFVSCASGPSSSGAGAPISSANYVAPPEATYKKIKFQATAGGALLGAGLGAGIAALSGGSSEQIAMGAVAGGLVGGVAGHEVGKKQAANVKGAANQNTALAGQIKDLKTTNSQLASYNKSLRSKISSMSAATAKANRKQLDKVLRTQNSNLKGAERSLSKASGNDAKKLASEVNRLKREVAGLQNTRSQLLKAEQGTRV